MIKTGSPRSSEFKMDASLNIDSTANSAEKYSKNIEDSEIVSHFQDSVSFQIPNFKNEEE